MKGTAMIDDDTAWAALERRDRTFDGRFVTGVLTTGIYCRPSCAARPPPCHELVNSCIKRNSQTHATPG